MAEARLRGRVLLPPDAFIYTVADLTLPIAEVVVEGTAAEIQELRERVEADNLAAAIDWELRFGHG